MTQSFSQESEEALDHLLKVAGCEHARSRHEVLFGGAPPALDTRHRIVAAQAAAIAAFATLVAHRWHGHTGQTQRVSVDALQATCSLNPCHFQRQNGHSVSPFILENEFKAGFYRTRDNRWFYPTAGYPHLRNGTLALLDCANTPAAIAKAIASFNAHELEEAFHERGLTGAVVRTRQEWREHPQGRVLATVPVIEIEKLREGPPVQCQASSRPLDDLRVLDMAHVIAGPTVARTFAEHGADVLRISSPLQADPVAQVLDTSIGKRNAYLNLELDRDVRRARELAAECDVFVQSWRPSSLGRRGFGPEQVAAINPGVVYVSVSCFGTIGPWRERKGFEHLGQAVTGVADAEAAGGVPRFAPTFLLNDYLTGYLGALGALAALLRRANEGGSYHVKVSLARTSMWIQELGLQDRPAETVAFPTLEPVLTSCLGPYGTLEQLGPVASLSRTRAHWARPVAPLGSSRPVWAGTK